MWQCKAGRDFLILKLCLYHRCSSLTKVNALLREQLDQANEANQALTESFHKASGEAKQREMQLKREQEVTASRLSREQARGRVIWRQAASLRSTFTQLRAFADRSLSDMRGEYASMSRRLHAACMSLEAVESEKNASTGLEVSALERQLKDKLREAMQLQAHFNIEKMEFNSRIQGLEDTVKHLKVQNSEKESSLAALKSRLDKTELSRAEVTAETNTLRSEVASLQQILYSIHQAVGEDMDSSSSESPGEEIISISPIHPSSPQHDSTLKAVRKALSKWQIQTQ
ncbi:rootletin isoform X1, partial [Tachysurus ichikawai]